jgi:hypothetical protein
MLQDLPVFYYLFADTIISSISGLFQKYGYLSTLELMFRALTVMEKILIRLLMISSISNNIFILARKG